MCTSCGAAGHIARDCRQRRPGQSQGTAPVVDRQKIDEEYMSLMAELGEGPPPPQQQTPTDAGQVRISNNGNAGPSPRSLFDRQVGPPRALMAPPPRSEGNQHQQFNPSQQQGGNGNNQGNGGNWNGGGGQFGHQGGPRPPMMGGNNQNGPPPNLNQPPPGMPWQQQQKAALPTTQRETQE